MCHPQSCAHSATPLPPAAQYILAFVGGIMAAVCVLELWPEARKCRADARLVAGVALGTLAMGWTLWVGV